MRRPQSSPIITIVTRIAAALAYPLLAAAWALVVLAAITIELSLKGWRYEQSGVSSYRFHPMWDLMVVFVVAVAALAVLFNSVRLATSRKNRDG